MIKGRGDSLAVADMDLDIAMSLVENYSSMQHSITGRQGTHMQSRELMVGYGYRLRSGSRLRQDGNVREGQGIVEDMTFYDSDRGCN
jgi:hypothetical protein